MYAFYWNNKTVEIVKNSNYSLNVYKDRQVFKVSGKKEAKLIAEQHNAKPWNF